MIEDEEGHGKKEELLNNEDESGETMMEGAWADILGSGHLKKKVNDLYTTKTWLNNLLK